MQIHHGCPVHSNGMATRSQKPRLPLCGRQDDFGGVLELNQTISLLGIFYCEGWKKWVLDKCGAKFFPNIFSSFLGSLAIKYLCKFFPALCELISDTRSDQVLVTACGTRWSRVRRRSKVFAQALLVQECLAHPKLPVCGMDCLQPEGYEAAAFWKTVVQCPCYSGWWYRQLRVENFKNTGLAVACYENCQLCTALQRCTFPGWLRETVRYL